MIKICQKQNKLREKKVLLFTHTDLDGVSCFVIAKQHFNFVRFFLCDYGNIETRMKENMELLDSFDMVLLTDLSVSVEFAKEYSKLCKEKNIEFYILDHHEKALQLGLNDFDFARILIHNKENKLTCGTELVHEFCLELGSTVTNETIESYIEDVRQYDTWEWKSTGNLRANDLNTLSHLISSKKYLISFSTKFRKNKYEFSEFEKAVLEMEYDKINYYVTKKMKNVTKKEILGYSCGIIFAEQYINEIAEELKKDESIDIAVIIGFNGVSYRTAKEIDLNAFAGHFGGGGHIRAAGSTIPETAKEEYLNQIFK